MTFAVAILTSGAVSCCGFKEAYQYRSGKVRKHLSGDEAKQIIEDEYFGEGYLRANRSYGVSETSLTEAAIICLNKWLASEKEYLARPRLSSSAKSTEGMRTFNFVSHNGDDETFYLSELRDAVTKLQCRKHIMSYRNANTGRLIETHILIIDKDTPNVE